MIWRLEIAVYYYYYTHQYLVFPYLYRREFLYLTCCHCKILKGGQSCSHFSSCHHPSHRIQRSYVATDINLKVIIDSRDYHLVAVTLCYYSNCFQVIYPAPTSHFHCYLYLTYFWFWLNRSIIELCHCLFSMIIYFPWHYVNLLLCFWVYSRSKLFLTH